LALSLPEKGRREGGGGGGGNAEKDHKSRRPTERNEPKCAPPQEPKETGNFWEVKKLTQERERV